MNEQEPKQDKRIRILRDEKPAKAVVRMGVPLIAGMCIMVLYNLVDTFFIGLLHDDYQLAAVNLGYPVMMISVAVSNMIGAGTASLIARSLGAGEREKAEHALTSGMVLTAVNGLIVTLAGLLFLPQIVSGLGADADTFAYTAQYTETLLGGSITYIEDVIISLLNERRVFLGCSDFEKLFTENEGMSKLPMYVLTNKVKTLGASCILDSDKLYDFSAEMDSDLFILPCSVHETILLPVNMGYDPEILSQMVKEINDSEVSKTDYLSDSVYKFSRFSGLVELA